MEFLKPVILPADEYDLLLCSYGFHIAHCPLAVRIPEDYKLRTLASFNALDHLSAICESDIDFARLQKLFTGQFCGIVVFRCDSDLSIALYIYEKTIELIPLLHHLQPPTFASRIEFSRFARYGTNPEEYGLELTGGPFLDTCRQNQDLYVRLHEAVNEWRAAFYSESCPHLVMNDSLFGLIIFDTRTIAPSPRVILLGLKARIYRLAKEPIPFNKIKSALPDDPEEDIRKCLDELVSQKLMINLSNRYLSLATGVSLPDTGQK